MGVKYVVFGFKDCRDENTSSWVPDVGVDCPKTQIDEVFRLFILHVLGEMSFAPLSPTITGSGRGWGGGMVEYPTPEPDYNWEGEGRGSGRGAWLKIRPTPPPLDHSILRKSKRFGRGGGMGVSSGTDKANQWQWLDF